MGNRLNTDGIRGFVCECGARHIYPVYVYEHWSEQLNFTCDDCGLAYRIRYGDASCKGKIAVAIKKDEPST